MSQNSELDSVGTVLWLQQADALNTFTKMWYHVFLWALFSSILVHTLSEGILIVTGTKINIGYAQMRSCFSDTWRYLIAALIAFLTLKKHKFGKFFPISILLMGVITPAVTGIVSSAAIAFVYRASSLPMNPLYALFWGCGQTFLTGCMGFTRILATL